MSAIRGSYSADRAHERSYGLARLASKPLIC